MRALLTGGTGFVGSHLAKRLRNEDWEVHLLVQPSTDISGMEALAHGVAHHRHDGTTGGMHKIVAEIRPEVVFHLASLFRTEHGPGDIEPMIRSNLLLGTQLVEAMTSEGIFRLVNTGTSWQHFGDEEYSPVCLYAATKQAFEDLLAYYVESTPLKVVTLKLFDTYGPGDRRGKLFDLLRKAALEGKPLAMSPGEQRIDLVYVDDVVDAFVRAAHRLERDEVRGHERYAVSSGNPVRLRDLVETYIRVTSAPLAVEWGGRPYRRREVMSPWSKGVGLPGWSPMVSLDEGISRCEDGQSPWK